MTNPAKRPGRKWLIEDFCCLLEENTHTHVHTPKRGGDFDKNSIK